MKNKFMLVVFLVLVLFPFVLSGCSQDNSSIQQTEGTNYYEFEPITDIKEGQPNVYAVLKVIKSEYWQEIIDGLQAAGNLAKANVYVGGPANESDWQIQDMLCEQAVANGADAIILAACNSANIGNELATLREKNIPVVLVDTIANSSDYDICYMTDNLLGGAMAAKTMIELLKENGVSENEPASIAIQIASTSSQTIIDRLAGFNQYWAQQAPKAWKVLDEVKTNGGDIEIATQNGFDLLKQYPDVKGMFSCNNGSTVGCATSLLESNAKDVVIVGFDYSDAIAGLIADPDWKAATIVQKQYDMGFKGLISALSILNGVDPTYKFIDTGVLVITHDNYKAYEEKKSKGKGGLS